MSVIMTLRAKADPKKLEETAARDPERMQAIVDRAKEHGLIAHRFYGSQGPGIMIVDEWPDSESFQRFFAQEREELEALLGEIGVTTEPEVDIWEKLETGDDVGWGT